MRQGIGDDRARANEDEGERPDEFSNERLHVALAHLLTGGGRLILEVGRCRQRGGRCLERRTPLLVSEVVAHNASFLLISKGLSQRASLHASMSDALQYNRRIFAMHIPRVPESRVRWSIKELPPFLQ